MFKRLTLILAILLANCASTRAANPPDWSRPFPPFRIAANLYYVGS